MDVFNLAAKISLDKSEYEDGLNDAKEKGSSFASAVGNGLKTVAKIGAAAVTAGAAGVTALVKMGVEGYAQYEQLVGGVETLFKTSQDTVMKYAENAYKTAGMSANEYMETVTSFSASLIQSLGGDTAKAAEVGNMAITDMSDNANKMGTSMEMIQNAYNGFAKGNFTMLDNLKLGYGGTQEEMKRLLADAEKLSGVKYDISSFADIAEAIHVMQEEMGIAGTTAREAATTIEGSLSMMKGAWQNLVVGMADENANMEVLINNFVESTVTVADNIMPRIEQALAGIGQLVEGLAPIIAEKLPAMVESLLPSLLNAAVSLVSSIASALPGLLDAMLPVVIQAALDIVMAIISVFTEQGAQILQTGIDAVLQIVDGIGQAMPDIINAAITLVVELVSTLTSPEQLNKLLDSAIVLIENIVTGLIDALPKLVDAAIQLIENLVIFITEPGNLEKLLSMAVKLVITIVNGLVDAIPQLVDAAIQLIMSLVAFLLDPENILMLVGAALSIVLAIVGGLIEARGELAKGAIKLIESLIEKFKETDWKKVGKDIIDNLLKGLKSAWESVKSWFSGAWNALFDKDANVSADDAGNVAVKGYATGLNYVPYDEFPALLHRGEAVLTAAQASAWRKGQKTPAMAGVTINQYIQAVPQTPVEIAAATEAYFEQARWKL
jgi:hypothetical protein